MRQSVGVMRNKTHLLFKYKEEQKQQANRFKKTNNIHTSKPNTLLLDSSGESTASNFSIEMQAHNKGLPSEWASHYEDCLDKIKQVQEILKELQILGSKRLKMQFGDATALEKLIYENNQKATQKIMECEKNTEFIANYSSDKETPSDQRIRMNINRALAQQIQELTNALRNQQKRMVTMIKQINKDDGGNFLKLSEQKQQEMKVADDELTQAEEQMYDDIICERDQEINKLVTMINELAEVFKSLNQLVIDQGTILDRIDYNIDQAVFNVKKANQELKKAEEYQNSPLAKRCIIILVIMIAICSILLTIKYSS
ncbi:unnamed protein product [Paramecium primaurelia]|uniref:t-SNARE coiled-coil homology domain-containing protein n=2 Tax=Paramecium TaxID=5884 RepID=A0A8S1Y155_9CILI|nr:unnamed protein product [Paramecium primaurelia]CAD8207741.1 unnamed protein product [Paramecium pentaurelia]